MCTWTEDAAGAGMSRGPWPSCTKYAHPQHYRTIGASWAGKTARTNQRIKRAHSNVTRQAQCDVGAHRSRCSDDMAGHARCPSICAEARRRMLVQAVRASAAAAAFTPSTTLTAPHELLRVHRAMHCP